ncbi:MAG: transporter substrate-binding domain-containing protein [Candidatus Limnocylindrales bacterium]
MISTRRFGFLAVAVLVAACAAPGATTRPSVATSAGASAGPTTAPTVAPTVAPPSATAAANIPAVVCVGEATTYLDWLNGEFQPDAQDPITEPASTTGDLLETIQANGVLRVSVDKDYAPQSFLQPDGSFVGFDVDVATAIAEGLGVEAEFQHVDWDLITAGSWAGRWDISVGSMTITTPRKDILSFTQPYYYTPAFMAASTRSGITDIDQLPFELPDGVTATTLPTDANCIEAIAAGRPEFDLVITSGTVIDEAIQNDQPVVKIEEPGFVEDLAVAIDKSGPPHAALLYEIDQIIGTMHEDGTLTALSEEWFEGADLTQPPAE